MSGLRRAKDTTGGVTRAAGSAAVSPASTPCAVSLVRRGAPESTRTERRPSAASRAPARSACPWPVPVRGWSPRCDTTSPWRSRISRGPRRGGSLPPPSSPALVGRVPDAAVHLVSSRARSLVGIRQQHVADDALQVGAGGQELPQGAARGSVLLELVAPHAVGVVGPAEFGEVRVEGVDDGVGHRLVDAGQRLDAAGVQPHLPLERRGGEEGGPGEAGPPARGWGPPP